MKPPATLSPLASAVNPRRSGALSSVTFTIAERAPASWPSGSERLECPPASDSAAAEAPLIYVVDDEPCLTELYVAVLTNEGYAVRAFNDRAKALTALKAERRKPELLITDYRGRSMPVEFFMCQCLAIHPALRILMASGFAESDLEFVQLRPDRFIRKPFLPVDLCRELRAAMAPRVTFYFAARL